jgi:hypothetical protein
MVSVARRVLSVFVLVLAVSVVVTGVRLPATATVESAASSPAASAVTGAAETCPPNDGAWIAPVANPRLCVAEMWRSTRNYLTSSCFDARAFQPNPVYGRSECRNAPNTQAEAVGQTRAIMRLNAMGFAGDSAAGGITPNLQWELFIPGGRPDVVLYDRTDPDGNVGLIEAKLNHRGTGNSEANDQLGTYEQTFPPGPNGRLPLRRALPAGYTDAFRVLVKDCDGKNGWRLVNQYWATATTSPGVLLISDPKPKATKCPEDPNQEPEPIPHEEDAGDWEDLPDHLKVPKGGRDKDGDGKDDFQQWLDEFLETTTDAEPIPDWDQSGEPVPVDAEVTVSMEVIATIVAAAVFCSSSVVASAVCAAAFRDAASAATVPAAMAILAEMMIAALLSFIGWHVFGDPHLATIDGLSYDLMSVGEFHLLEVPEYGIDVQGRFGPIGDNVSALRSVALEINDDRVELGNNTLKVNGEPVEMASQDVYELGEGAAVVRDGTKWGVLWPGYRDRLMMLKDGGNVGFHVPDGMKTRGLAGDNDGDPADDLALRDGTQLPDNASPSVVHGSYADAWRITDEESLFAYGEGESTATYTDRSFPAAIPSIGDYTEAEIAAATAICEEAGVVPGPQYDDCVFDVVATGDESYADAAALVTDVLVDPAAHEFDQNGRLAEDFEGTVANNFAAPRYREDPATTRMAGPLFDAPGYQLTARSIGRHDSIRLATDLYAYGPIADDSAPQSVDLVVGDTVAGTANLDVEGGPTLSAGLDGTIQQVGTGTTAGGEPYTKFALDVRLPHATSAFDLQFQPKNFRGVLNTSLGVDNVELTLSVPEADTFNVSLPLVVPSEQAGTADGAGVLETNGGQDEYTFDLDTPTPLVLAQTTCLAQMTYTLVETTTQFRTPLARESCRSASTEELPAGTYRLEATGSKAGSYAFELRALPAPQTFAYTLGQTVSDGVPAPGAGNLEQVGSEDHYTFTVPTGGRQLLYEQLAGYKSYDLVNASTGAVIRHGYGNSTQMDLEAGSYRLEFADTRPGPYSWRLIDDPAPQTFDYTLGTRVSDGVPALGAGNLETAGSIDRYQFSIPDGGMTIQYESGPERKSHTLKNLATGATVWSGNYSRQKTLAAGRYQLEFTSVTASTYSFSIYQVPQPQDFDYTIGETVSDGVPAPGAGNLETMASKDRYRFTIPAGGARIKYDETAGSTTYVLTNTDTGAQVATGNSDREFDLQAGNYQMEFRGTEAGTYEFKLVVVPAPQSFDYTLGTTVSDGVPAPGAGNLETALSKDRYLFTVPTGGALLQYQDLSGYKRHALTNTATGSQIYPNWKQQFDLPAGAYRLEFADPNPGTYSFKLFEVPEPQTFDYAIGDTVSDGVPAQGAGNLETIASEDRYRFTVPSGGLRVQYRYLSGVLAPYTVTDTATGAVVATGYTGEKIDLSAGEYQIALTASSQSGAYSFKLIEVPQPQTFDYTVGDTVSDGVPAAGAGNLEADGAEDHYRFIVPNGGAHIAYDGIQGENTSYVITNADSGASVGAGGGTFPKSFHLPAGNYQIAFSAYVPTTTYSFRLFVAPPPQTFDIQIGDTVSDGNPEPGAGNLETAGSEDRFRFTVPAGGVRVQYQAVTDHQQYALYNADTGQRVASGVASAQHQLQAGNYEIAITPYTATGSYSFKLLTAPVP